VRQQGAAFKWLKSGSSFLLKKAVQKIEESIKLVKYEIKFADDVAGLIEGSAVRESSLSRKIPEIITFTKLGSFKDAVAIAKSKVGNLVTPFKAKLGPNAGRITGFGDEVNHWRLDWSADIGVHIN
jgi:hypothetical protein